MCVLYPQDPSSPRSVQSYSSRENGLDKLPPSRKEPLPQASPTSLASSSSAASPSRSKDPPPVHTHTNASHLTNNFCPPPVQKTRLGTCTRASSRALPSPLAALRFSSPAAKSLVHTNAHTKHTRTLFCSKAYPPSCCQSLTDAHTDSSRLPYPAIFSAFLSFH